MLKKLLYYDFKSVYKFWWIAALSTFALSFVGGFSLSVFITEKELPVPVYIIAIFALILTAFAMFAFIVLSEILVYIRFYKNFFSDEGYLTFTLPAKRKSLLNSKILLGVTTSISTFVVNTINTLIMIVIAFHKEIFTKQFFKDLADLFTELFETIDPLFVILYVIEGIAIFILLALSSLLFTYNCITIASIIAKKAKILVAIGIYYGANVIVSFIFEMFYIFGITSLINIFTGLSGNVTFWAIALLLAIVLVFVAIVFITLYTLERWMLERKLNLT